MAQRFNPTSHTAGWLMWVLYKRGLKYCTIAPITLSSNSLQKTHIPLEGGLSIKQRIRLLLSYDGSSFKGWQKQPFHKASVQQSIEEALSQMLNTPITLIGAGRTDAGVHALGQNAHFDSPKKIPKPHLFVAGLNALTSAHIVCHQAWQAPFEFHAQKSALHRTYTYIIFNTQTPMALNSLQGYWLPAPVCLNQLNQMANLLIGNKNFKSFQNTGTLSKSTFRTIYQARWFWMQKNKVLAFQICGNSFLKQMVRNIVGTQLRLMKKPSEAIPIFQSILQAQDRTKAFETAPAHGLYLHHIAYPQLLIQKCQKFKKISLDKKFQHL